MTTNNTYPDWSSSKKVKARNETIINMYRSIFGTQSIPENKQYWTMCGQNGDENGNLKKDCELEHITSSRLITENQFFGVEKNKQIFEINKKISKIARWINDLYQAIIKEDNKNNFNPAIINIDHVKMPHSGGVNDIVKILYLSDKTTNNVMVVGNLVLKCYTHRSNYKDFTDRIFKHRLFQKIKNNWNVHGYLYIYEGSNNGNTTEMGTMILWKKVA